FLPIGEGASVFGESAVPAVTGMPSPADLGWDEAEVSVAEGAEPEAADVENGAVELGPATPRQVAITAPQTPNGQVADPGGAFLPGSPLPLPDAIVPAIALGFGDAPDDDEMEEDVPILTAADLAALFTASFQSVPELAPLLHRIESLSVEDVHSSSWPHLLAAIRYYASNLRLLNLEAVGNQDAFDHSQNLSLVFPSLTKLEFLRLDGVTVGPNSSLSILAASGGASLKAITMDYCVDVTMEALGILWENCPLLSFIGLAGIMMTPSSGNQADGAPDATAGAVPGRGRAVQPQEPVLLSERPLLRTIRFVDCDVTDDLLEKVALLATRLEMIRVVFEDDQCEGVLRTWRNLSDRALMAFVNPFVHGGASGSDPALTAPQPRLPSLRVLALSWCPRMTAASLVSVLAANRITVLDLHKDPRGEIGCIDDSLLETIADHVSNVEVLHLYGQHLRRRCPDLESLSVVGCDAITEDDVRSLLANDTNAAANDAESDGSGDPTKPSPSSSDGASSTRATSLRPLRRLYSVVGVEVVAAHDGEDGVEDGGRAAAETVLENAMAEPGRDADTAPPHWLPWAPVALHESQGAPARAAEATRLQPAPMAALDAHTAATGPPVSADAAAAASELGLVPTTLEASSGWRPAITASPFGMSAASAAPAAAAAVDASASGWLAALGAQPAHGGPSPGYSRWMAALANQGALPESAVVVAAAPAETAAPAAEPGATASAEGSDAQDWPANLVREDRWFVDEGLDVISLWEAAVVRECGRGGRVYL
ncbi:hypothetical protein HK405_006623, partial [Cladochytrium tenue]